MIKLVFATNNTHKLREISQMLGDNFNLLSLNDINCNEDIPETQPTIEGNAQQKAFYVYNNYGVNCFADDTGLEVEALNGEPGVFSARYAGDAKSSEANIIKLLKNLENKTNRKARFKTVISLVIDGNEIQFEGIINGTIIDIQKGTAGFGYDPVFLPDGYSQTFAEMDAGLKNKISHRALAFKKLIDYLKTL